MFSGYTMETTHFYVGETPLPQKKKGKNYENTVAPGAYTDQHDLTDATTDSITVDRLDGKPKYIIAHASVWGSRRRHRVLGEEGCPCVCSGSGRKLEEAPEVPEGSTPVKCADAFGYHSDKVSTSFKDMGFAPQLYDNNDISWGWSNGPLASSNFAYTLDLYADGLSGNVDGKGTVVGTMSVAYDGKEVTVTVDAGERLWLKEVHAYVGNEPLPKDNNNAATIDPSQFPVVHKRMALSRSFSVENFEGRPIYVVTHATVCGVYEEDDSEEQPKVVTGVKNLLRRIF
jgi:hypothetical protein